MFSACTVLVFIWFSAQSQVIHISVSLTILRNRNSHGQNFKYITADSSTIAGTRPINIVPDIYTVVVTLINAAYITAHLLVWDNC